LESQHSGGHAPAYPKLNIATGLKIGISRTDRNFGILASLLPYNGAASARVRAHVARDARGGKSHIVPRAIRWAMENALSSRTPSIYVPLNGGQGLGAAVGRDQYVLLRIPDCSTRLAASTDDAHAESLAIAMGLRKLVAVLRGIATPWRRPRTMVTAVVSIGFVLFAVALYAATRQHGVDHADGDPHDAADAAPEWGTVVAGRADSSGANASANVLDDAPPFAGSDVNQGRPNQPAAIGQSSERRATGTSAPDDNPRKSATAHLEQRIERVPTQFGIRSR
jgi:hypothetical protein